MKPITLTPVFGRIFDAMDVRDNAVGFIVSGCAPTAHGAGSLQVDIAAGTFVSNSGAFTAFAGGNKTPGGLINPLAARCDLIYFDNVQVLQIAAGAEVVVSPNSPAVPPAIPAGGTPVALAYITPGAVDYGVATTAFVEDIRQFYAPTFLPDGAVGAPSLSFGNQRNTGMWRPGAGIIALSAASVEVMRWDAGLGRVRLARGMGFWNRNNADTSDFPILYADTSDIIQIAPFGQQITISGNITAPISFFAIGTTPALSGIIRLGISNGAGTQFITQRNQANTADLYMLGAKTNDDAQMNPALRIVGAYLEITQAVNPASAGTIRLINGAGIYWRNNANNGDIAGIATNASDQLVLGVNTLGVQVGQSGGSVGFYGGTPQVIGSNGQVLTVVAGVVKWANPGASTVDKVVMTDTTTSIAASGTLTKTATVTSGRNLARSATRNGATLGGVVFGGTVTTDAFAKGTVGGAEGVSDRGVDATLFSHTGINNLFGLQIDLQDFYINGTSLTWVFINGDAGSAHTVSVRANAHVW